MGIDDTNAASTDIREAWAKAEGFLDSCRRFSVGECWSGDSKPCQIARETLVSLGTPWMGSWNPVALLSGVLFLQNTLRTKKGSSIRLFQPHCLQVILTIKTEWKTDDINSDITAGH